MALVFRTYPGQKPHLSSWKRKLLREDVEEALLQGPLKGGLAWAKVDKQRRHPDDQKEHAPLLRNSDSHGSSSTSARPPYGSITSSISGKYQEETTRTRYDPQDYNRSKLNDDDCYMMLVRSVGRTCGVLRTYIPCCDCLPGPRYYQRVEPNEAGVVSDFGRYVRTLPPGTHAITPFAQQMSRVTISERLLDLRQQTVLSSDGFTATADGLLYYNIVDPRAAVFDVQDVATCLAKLAKTALRDTFAGYTLQECLDKRKEIAAQVREAVHSGAQGWGIHVRLVLIEDVHLDTTTAKLFAADAIAQRAAAAKITEARAEVEAAKLMREAAEALNSPAAMQLRGLDTLRTIAASSSARTVFVPMPSNLVSYDTVTAAMNLTASDGIAGHGGTSQQI